MAANSLLEQAPHKPESLSGTNTAILVIPGVITQRCVVARERERKIKGRETRVFALASETRRRGGRVTKEELIPLILVGARNPRGLLAPGNF